MGNISLAQAAATVSHQFNNWRLFNASLTEFWFYVPLDRKYVISETFPKTISQIGTEKLNPTQQKHTFTNQKKYITTQNKHIKLKPGLVASYDIRPENRDSLFWFWRFINLSLTYLLLRHLPTYLEPGDPHTAEYLTQSSAEHMTKNTR